MITITEITKFETRLTELMANFKAEVMAELKKVGIKQPDNFLQELSQPVPLVADEPPPPAEPPNMDGVTLEDEPQKDFIERDSKEFLALVEFSLKKGWEKSHVDNFLIKKGLQLSEKTESHLNELRKFGKMEKAGQMDVATLLGQNCLSEVEKSFLTGIYIF